MWPLRWLGDGSANASSSPGCSVMTLLQSQAGNGPIQFVGGDHTTLVEPQAGTREQAPGAQRQSHIDRCPHGDVGFVATAAQIGKDIVALAGAYGLDSGRQRTIVEIGRAHV